MKLLILILFLLSSIEVNAYRKPLEDKHLTYEWQKHRILSPRVMKCMHRSGKLVQYFVNDSVRNYCHKDYFDMEKEHTFYKCPYDPDYTIIFFVQLVCPEYFSAYHTLHYYWRE